MIMLSNVIPRSYAVVGDREQVTEVMNMLSALSFQLSAHTNIGHGVPPIHTDQIRGNPCESVADFNCTHTNNGAVIHAKQNGGSRNAPAPI
jgi:hypothetical protein